MKTIIILFLITLPSITIAQRHHKESKQYLAKIYSSENVSVKGILFSVNDSSISIYVDSSLSSINPINVDSSKILTVYVRDIQKIELF